jgi:RND family efflux transporter MFP subunit
LSSFIVEISRLIFNPVALRTLNILTAIIFATLIAGCGGSEENSTPSRGGWGAGAAGFGDRVTAVETITAERDLIAEQVRSFGTVQAQELVAVTPQVSNRITEIYVDLGDEVKKGQALAKIYDVALKDQYEQAKAQVDQARVTLERDSTQFVRQQQLYEKQLISQTDYDVAYAAYQNAAAQYATALANRTQARENLANTIIRSPADGTVVSRTIEVGNLATTGTPVFEINSDSGYETRLYLPVQDWKVVRVGQEVNLRASNEKEASVTGVVSRKSPRLDPTTGLGEVVVTLNGMGESIFAGVLTESSINIQVKPNALLVPRGALVEKVETVVEPESNTIQLEKSYSVFVAQGDSIAVQLPLVLGIEQGDKIEVLSGLRPGEKVVITGQQGLRDGARIKVATGENFSTPEEMQITREENGRPGARQSGRPGANQRGQALANMSEEDRSKLRERMQSMSPDERREFVAAYRDSVRKANASNN